MPFSRRNLPHIDQGGVNYFVTYRQAGTWKNEGTRVAEPTLCQPEIADLIIESWKNLSEKRIWLHALCIMPDHVHAVITPKDGGSISRILYSHKRFTAARINRFLGKTGPFWQDESFDRIIREGKFNAAVEYTIMNPVKAAFVQHWKDWPYTLVFEDSTCRAIL